jgi:hypothetical protein
MVFGVLVCMLYCTLTSPYVVHNEAESLARFLLPCMRTAGSPHCSLSPVEDSGLSQNEFDDVHQPITARIHWLNRHTPPLDVTATLSLISVSKYVFQYMHHAE